ncbi:MAG TPA: hypothetical protein VKC60_10465 [Opitutaceae bacterium]|nr:hypothetical protein [Opitutaceae bacterium]
MLTSAAQVDVTYVPRVRPMIFWAIAFVYLCGGILALGYVAALYTDWFPANHRQIALLRSQAIYTILFNVANIVFAVLLFQRKRQAYHFIALVFVARLIFVSARMFTNQLPASMLAIGGIIPIFFSLLVQLAVVIFLKSQLKSGLLK